MNKNKTQFNIFVWQEVKDHALSNPEIDCISDWFQEKYIEEFMGVESLRDKIKESEKNTKRFIEELKKQEKIAYKKLPSLNALLHIKTKSPKIIKNGGTMEGALFRFNEAFKLDITMKQFKKWMNTLKPKSIKDIENMYLAKSKKAKN